MFSTYYRFIVKIYVFQQNKSYFTFMTCKGEFEKHCHEDLMELVSLKGYYKAGFKDDVKPETRTNCHCQGEVPFLE